MSIIAATDFSPAADTAADGGAAIAQKLGVLLVLAHVLDAEEPHARSKAEFQGEAQARDLRQRFGIDAECIVKAGPAAPTLKQLASQRSAQLIVLGADGASRRRGLGGVPEALCQTSTLPVLVVRESDSLAAWATGSGELQVLLGTGLGGASRSALGWARRWPSSALTIAYIAWPYAEHNRLGVSAPMPLDHLRPELHRVLMRDLEVWAATVPGTTQAKLSVTASFGRIDAHLAELAREKRSELLVVGNHRRNFASRFWHGSVSRNVLHEAGCNVVCVPSTTGQDSMLVSPRSLLIPTDFSSHANRAIRVGYGMLPHGGTVHLVHVLTDSTRTEEPVAAELRALIPKDADELGVSSELHVLKSKAPWLAIWQEAGRLGVDLICMATHSRTAAASIALGSQALELLKRSRVPVVLVPPDRED